MLKIVPFPNPLKKSIFVVVKAVAEITLTPLAKISAVVPFHFITTFVVIVVVVYKGIVVVAILLDIRTLEELASPLKNKLFVPPVEVSPIKRSPLALSLAIAKLFLNSTNQVPPAEVILPLV
jgi:hypothetical protein